MSRMPYSIGKVTSRAAWFAVIVFVAGCGLIVIEAPPRARAPRPLAVGPSTPAPTPRPAPAAVAERPPARPPAFGTPMVAVPALVGLPYEWAEETLRANGLLVGDVDYRQSPKALGTVLAQRPKAGERVSTGSRIRLTLARARAVPSMVSVPRVVGTDQTSAESLLERAGLAVGSVSYQTVEGDELPQVGRQSPAAGSLAYSGASVDIVVFVPRPARRVPVPDLFGMARVEAVRAIGQAGLLHAGTSYAPGPGTPADRVMSQAPPARTLVEAGSGVSLVVSSGAGRTRVPNVVGREVAGAISEIRRARLRASVTHAAATGIAGRVISQNPAAGRLVARGSVVRLVVRTPPVQTGKVTVPDIVGRTKEEAEGIIRAAGLVPGKVRFRPGAPGRVLAQIPTAGTIAEKGSMVSYVMGRRGVVHPPKKRVRVPDVVGRTQAQAKAELAGAGLEVGTVSTAHGRAGVVLEQKPAAGKVVMVGFKVSLVVGRAAEPRRKVRVPNVIGLRQDRGEATRTLAAAGLKVGRVTYAPGEAGVVLSQKPGAGAIVTRASNVDIVVGRRHPGTVKVPRVIGLRYDRGEARRTLATAGLRLGRVTYAAGHAGVVLSQGPAAGTFVARGSAVDLVVGRRESSDKVTVPNLVGMQRGQASAALRRAGLATGRTSYVEGKRPNEVVRQSPAGGTAVARGSSVDLVVVRPGSKPGDKPDDKPATVVVPNVIGQSIGRARIVIQRAGLRVGTVGYRKVKKGRKNAVVSQSPRAGQAVEKNSAVHLVVAR